MNKKQNTILFITILIILLTLMAYPRTHPRVPRTKKELVEFYKQSRILRAMFNRIYFIYLPCIYLIIAGILIYIPRNKKIKYKKGYACIF